MLPQQCSSMLSWQKLSPQVANGEVLEILKEKPNDHPKPNNPQTSQTQAPNPAGLVLFMYLHIFGFFYSLLLEFVEIFYMPVLGKEAEKIQS